jgi:hypothetical protein
MQRGRAAFGITVLACAWLVFLVPAAAIVPTYSEQTSYGGGFISHSSTTLVGANGSWVLVPMAIPALLGLIAWLGMHRKCSGRGSGSERLVWLPIAVMCALSLVSGFSVGPYFLPAALALGLAAALTPRGHATH